jgi:Ca2+-transporting ATPase
MTFDARNARGLDESEARRRLVDEGPNSLPEDARKGVLRGILAAAREPMVLLLLIAGGLYGLLGDRIEAATLLASVAFVVGIAFVQARKTERALAALRDLTNPRALVIREGKATRVASEHVVRGDLVIVAEGDRVPVDATVLECSNLSVDESLLTGESVSVRKREVTSTDVAAAPGGDDTPHVFAGTMVVNGRAIVEARATGARSEIGKIGAALGQNASMRSPLEREVDTLVRRVAVAAVGVSLLLAVVHGLRSRDPIGGLLAGVSLAMSLLPEELPIVLTVFFAIGALRLSQVRVLTRHMPAIETLGATTVLCTDKTGTLTENRMRVSRLWVDGCTHDVGDGSLPEAVHGVVEHGVLASQRDPFDPMEIAFHALSDGQLAGTEHVHRDFVLVREYPLSKALLSMAHVWRAPSGDVLVVSAKGAPEAIVDLCHLEAEEAERIRGQVVSMARDGLRVLGVACTETTSELPSMQHDFAFRFVGLVGLEDPVRANVPLALAECREAGIRVIMITGDYPETATAIARKAGFARPERVIRGSEVADLDDAALASRLREVDVIARAIPEHKTKIVRALAASGEVVAMTGDGVNDAPALESAHIGIAMGGRGTDVAREAADLVITDDDFSSIVAGARLGRRIFDNLRKVVVYILAVHVPIAGLALLPSFFGLPLMLHPLQIVFLELIIDPSCSLVFEVEPEEADVMRRPPRSAGAQLVSAQSVRMALAQGASVLVASFGCLLFAHARGFEEGAIRAVAFTSLVGGNLALIQVNRSWSRRTGSAPRGWLVWIVVGLTVSLLALVLFVEPFTSLLRLAPISLGSAGLAFATGALSVAWVELRKRFGKGLFSAGRAPARAAEVRA